MRKKDEIDSAFSETSELNGAEGFFLVGIGGAGMSALARMLLKRGHRVHGADAAETVEVERLRAEGIQITVGHTGDPIADKDAVVVSDAIDLQGSPEVQKARSLKLPIVRRSQALGWLLRSYKTIAVTGTHGKTTTTAMLGSALAAAGMDPLVVVGASVPEWHGPIREGTGVYAVVEACEAYDSLHDLDPEIVVLTNLELDHVDFHGTYENLRNSMVRFVDRIPPEGWLVYCSEDRGASEVAELTDARAVPYGASEEWQRLVANKIGLSEPLPGFPHRNNLLVPGRHNLLNAAAALTAAALVHADLDKVEQALREFGGAERRLQVLSNGPVTVVDDYAHHPSEITASLIALRERYFGADKPGRRLIVVFQPHLYSRTAPLISQFARSLDLADQVVVTDIYPAREEPIPGVSSALIAEALEKPCVYVPNRRLLPRKVASMVGPGDVVVGMGAGNIGEFAPALLDELLRIDDIKNDRRKLRVAVVYGGDSAEREVSLHSGLEVNAALERLGYESRLIDVSDMLLGEGQLHALVGGHRPDVAFLAVHGTNGEDGAIQGLLELLHIPYTGSGVQASAICMDKSLTKSILKQHGIKTPSGVLLSSMDDSVGLPLPLIVKPNAQGSTVGLSFVEDSGSLCPALEKAFSYGDQVLVEEWIVGTEISTPVLDDEPLIPVEIVPEGGRYDFASKYSPGATAEIIPAGIPEKLLERAREIALQAHKALGCKGATRTDAIVRDNEIYVLEVNTLPGLTKTSLLPNSAAAAGISFDELCERMVEDALRRYAAKEKQD